MSQRKYNKEELEEAVKNSLSIAEVLRHLNIIPAGGNYFTIKRYIKLWNIDTSHFTGKLWNKGKHTICNSAKPLKEILKEDLLGLCPLGEIGIHNSLRSYAEVIVG